MLRNGEGGQFPSITMYSNGIQSDVAADAHARCDLGLKTKANRPKSKTIESIALTLKFWILK